MNRKTILHDTLLLTAANLTLRTVSLLFQVYLSGIIGAAGMGRMQLVLTAGGFAMTLGTSGVRVASMNLTAEECGLGRDAGRKKAITACLLYALCFSVPTGLALCIAARPIAMRWIHDSSTAFALRLLGLSLPLNCLSAVLGGYFTARGKIRPLVAVEILERMLSIAATVLMLRFCTDGTTGRSVAAVVGGSTLSAAFGFLLLLRMLQKDLCGIRGSREIPMMRRLLHLCVPLALGDYLRSGLATLEQFLIPWGLAQAAQSREVSMAAYGVIGGMVFPILMFPAALFYSLSDRMVPELSRCRARGSRKRIRFLTGRCLRIGTVYAAAVAGGMYVLAPALGMLFYHSADAGAYLRLFAPLILMLYPDALTDGMLKGLGEQAAGVRYNTLTAAMDVALLWLLLPRVGIAGYYFSFAVTHGVNFALSLHRLCTVSRCKADLPHALRTVCAAVLAAAATLHLAPASERPVSVLLSGTVFLLLFFVSGWLLGAVRKSDLHLFLPCKKLPAETRREEAS